MGQWFYQQDGARQGPVSLDELKVLIVKGSINAETLVWSKDMDTWQALSSVEALTEFLESAPPMESAEEEQTSAPDEEATPPPIDGIEDAEVPERQPAPTSPLGEKLRALAQLREEGLLSEEEFASQKAKILAGGGKRSDSLAESTDDGTHQMPCPPSNMGGAIFATLCCCLPFGVVAIVKASKVAGIYRQEGYDAALSAAEDAKKWVMISIGFGVLGIIIQVLAEAGANM